MKQKMMETESSDTKKETENRIIRNVKIPMDGFILENSDILIADGKIKRVGKGQELLDTRCEIIDGEGHLIIPGFIDCHTHGFNGYRAEDQATELKNMAIKYAQRGITGFYATVGPECNEEYFRIFNEYRSAFGDEYEGARFLGLHVEGPFLSVEKKGAMEESKLRKVSETEVKKIIEAGSDVVKMMTIAPELEGALEAIQCLSQKGIIASIGHSMATYEEAILGIKAGATQATHMYNAMRSFDHRETGIIGAAALNDTIYCELIMDCVHVSIEAMKMLINLKGPDRVMAVSDGDIMCGSNSRDKDMGEYIIKNGAMYLKNGVLCGSIRDLADHFKTIIDKLGMGITDAIKLTSTNCAAHMKLKKGRIEVGYDADFNLMDNDFNVLETYVGGQHIKRDKIGEN